MSPSCSLGVCVHQAGLESSPLTEGIEGSSASNLALHMILGVLRSQSRSWCLIPIAEVTLLKPDAVGVMHAVWHIH